MIGLFKNVGRMFWNASFIESLRHIGTYQSAQLIKQLFRLKVCCLLLPYMCNVVLNTHRVTECIEPSYQKEKERREIVFKLL